MKLTIEIDEAECLGIQPEALVEALRGALRGGLTLPDGPRIELESLTVLFDPEELEESMTQLVARTDSELAIEATRLGVPAPRTALERILVRMGGSATPRPIPAGRKLKVVDPAMEREKLLRCVEYIERCCAGDQERAGELQEEMKKAYRWQRGSAEIFVGGWRFAGLIDQVLESAEERERATRVHLAMVIAYEWTASPIRALDRRTASRAFGSIASAKTTGGDAGGWARRALNGTAEPSGGRQHAPR